jgi:hypothetical protein
MTLVVPVSASPKVEVSGFFHPTTGVQTMDPGYPKMNPGGIEIRSYTWDITWHGSFNGTSVDHIRSVMAPQGPNSLIHVSFTGTLTIDSTEYTGTAEMRLTFRRQSYGPGEGVAVLHGTGGDLVGLHGILRITWELAPHPMMYSGTVHFDPK